MFVRRLAVNSDLPANLDGIVRLFSIGRRCETCCANVLLVRFFVLRPIDCRAFAIDVLGVLDRGGFLCRLGGLFLLSLERDARRLCHVGCVYGVQAVGVGLEFAVGAANREGNLAQLVAVVRLNGELEAVARRRRHLLDRLRNNLTLVRNGGVVEREGDIGRCRLLGGLSKRGRLGRRGVILRNGSIVLRAGLSRLLGRRLRLLLRIRLIGRRLLALRLWLVGCLLTTARRTLVHRILRGNNARLLQALGNHPCRHARDQHCCRHDHRHSLDAKGLCPARGTGNVQFLLESIVLAHNSSPQ